ncbi:MAG TPA: hypothetical protein VJ827_03400 [Rubrobacter sp.]|nr:hypothetical protein [Rubrobacter sp.]
MIERTTDPRTGISMVVGILSSACAVTFFFGALLHLGVRVPLGSTVLAEPTILPATIVEGLCGLALLFAALAVGSGPSTDLSTIYHRVMLVALVAVLALLLAPAGRTVLSGTRRK